MSGKPKDDWRQKLKDGRIQTPFNHYSLLADGIAEDLASGFECPPGRAWMSLKVWAPSEEAAVDMVQAIGNKIGFELDGKIMLYETEPDEPPAERPFAYSIDFTPYNE